MDPWIIVIYGSVAGLGVLAFLSIVADEFRRQNALLTRKHESWLADRDAQRKRQLEQSDPNIIEAKVIEFPKI